MSNSIWKGFERDIANWMATRRNMGSGRINSSDDGKPRPGDVVLPISYSALIECKTRKDYPKSGMFPRMEDTLKEAKDLGIKNFFHFERKMGNKKIYILATSPEWMEKICGFIKKELHKNKVEEDFE